MPQIVFRFRLSSAILDNVWQSMKWPSQANVRNIIIVQPVFIAQIKYDLFY